MKTIQEQIEEHRAVIHAQILRRNPGREFEVLIGRGPDGRSAVAVVWMDNKGELL